MGFRLKILISDGTEELVDDVFEAEDMAQAEYESWLDSWGAGRETLELAGEEYSDAEIEDCEIWEE